jgi:hypothetical protein
MRFICWDMVIEHHNDVCLTNTNYFSWLGTDLCFDTPLKDYIQHIGAIWRCSPTQQNFRLHPNTSPTSAAHASTCLKKPRRISRQPPPSTPVAEPTVGLQPLSHQPVSFRTHAPNAIRDDPTAHCLYNSEITRAAGMLVHFDWAVYGFSSSHFWSTIQGQGLPFRVILACDPFVHGPALDCDLSGCKMITDTAPAMLDYICGSGITSKLTGYLIHSH